MADPPQAARGLEGLLRAFMAIFRSHPYGAYNFRVAFDGVETIFAEARIPTAEIEVVEYREGGDRTNEVRRLPGITTYTNLVLRRGVVGSTDLWEWFKATRQGDLQRRSVVVTLLDEKGEPVMTYKLRNCLPVKYVGPTLRAGASDVAIEEVELMVEGIDLE
jgi:phage tail-like protein